MVNNNGYLIDTHIFIWWMEKSNKLPQELFDLLNNPHNKIFLSVVSVWEIVLKKRKKKLDLSMDMKVSVQKSKFSVLPIEIDHVFGIDILPLHHKDPFDRILISQAIVEKLTLITTDDKIVKYNLPMLKI